MFCVSLISQHVIWELELFAWPLNKVSKCYGPNRTHSIARQECRPLGKRQALTAAGQWGVGFLSADTR
eukprot:2090195-Amphidinium_carterae.1